MGKACLTDKINDDKILFNWVAVGILLCIMLVHFNGQVDRWNRTKDIVNLSFSHLNNSLMFLLIKACSTVFFTLYFIDFCEIPTYIQWNIICFNSFYPISDFVFLQKVCYSHTRGIMSVLELWI